MRTILTTAVLLALVLFACDIEEKPTHASGHLCTCEQRQAVADYVAANQRAGMADDSELYLDHLYAIAVRTHCDHRDSVPTTGHGAHAIGLAPCEAWHRDHCPIRP